MNFEKDFLKNNCRVPIIVGVTGHRDIPGEDWERLKSSVKQALEEVQNQCPNSPYVLLTALAEGADRLAAEVALELEWQIGVVLPLEQDDYETDFSSQESKDEFRKLLSKASWMVVADSTDQGEHLSAMPPRDRAYYSAGVHIIRMSQIVFALWDGSRERKTGGTSDMVFTALEGIRSAPHDLAIPDSTPVWQIVTRRSSQPNQVSNVGTLNKHTPNPDGFALDGEDDRWEAILERIDQFNADALKAIDSHPQDIEKSHDYLGKAAPELAQRPGWLFAVADYISTTAQNERKQIFKQMICAAITLIFFDQLYSGPFFSLLWLVLALLAGGVCYYLYKSSSDKRLEERYLDYRALAEACRVQYFWKMGGLPDRVGAVFLRRQRDELEWIRRAVITTELESSRKTRVTIDEQQLFDYIAKCWITDQQCYFVGAPGKKGGNNAKRNEEESSRCNRRQKLFFKAGIGVMLLLAITHVIALATSAESVIGVLPYVIVAYSMLFTGTAVVLAWGETQAFSEHAKRYWTCGIAMAMAKRNLDWAVANKDYCDARSILRSLGNEALAESGDWLLLHRDRPVRAPIG
ncbi:hypothetical protein AGMMS50256_34210 [Betaproteobacteria bacterium]|nr:hypothetical protein AGMMS50256_34210 [Betaproteobacteria bacterium]